MTDSPESVRVLHLGPDMDGQGGMAAVVRNLLASPLRDRFRLSFVSTHSTSSPLRRLVVFAQGLGRLIRWCAGSGKRIVHIHVAKRGSWYRKALSTRVASRLGRPVVLHFHSGPVDMRSFEESLGPLRRRALIRAFSHADRVLAVSTASADEVQRILRFDRVEVVPNAAPSISRGAIQAPSGDDLVTVTYLGGFFNPAKGGEVLLAALPELLERCPEIELVLAGPGEPPREAQPFLGRPNVRWEGYLDEAGKARLLPRTQVFLMPSVSEGLPLALLEAMVYGHGIVATRVGGIPEVVVDDVNALLVEPRDPHAFAQAAITLVEDPARRARLGEAARRRAERMNDAEVFDRLEAVWRELSDGAGRAT